MVQPAKRRHTGANTVATMIGTGMLLSALILPGCYQRVTRAKGFGADGVAVSEPYQETSKLDNWIFGEEPKRNKSILDRH